MGTDRYEKMDYSFCGKSGLMLPRVSLGLWHNFGSVDSFENMRSMCRTAFDNGIVHFDIANNYGPEPGSAEENFGRILKKDFHTLRDELLISTKAGYYMWEGPYGDGGSRKYLISSLDQSLKRLRLDYVDIFYHHRMTPDTPLEETCLALSQIVHSGKALYAGLSNYDGETMEKASKILSDLKVPFVINQNPYNILNRGVEDNGLLYAAKSSGKGVICFSPLAQGLLTDRYLEGVKEGSRASRNHFLKNSRITPEYIMNAKELNAIAAERGQTLAQMALSWVLKNDAVTSVLIGASSAEQILDDIKCIDNTAFSADELAKIDEIAERINKI
ncbi:MAG: aldo/keto reductase [Clostridia bacterium]|nr:aldo/keto reductase [Clostridia bacterium]